MKTFFLFLSFLCAVGLNAQDSSTNKITWSGYAEVYHQFDFNKPENNNLPSFLYSHNRHNEFNLNLGFIKVNYTDKNVRANLALATGTYVNANYAAEPGVIKNLLEANIGLKLSKRKSLWLDAGIFPSHIGFESAVSKDCWTLSRSVLAENSPYFEAGAKLTYTSNNEQWVISALALNGWQRITRVPGNSMISWGTQFQFRPNEKILLNYSNFIGTDQPDSTRLLRIFHNIYGQFTITDNMGVILGFDIGTQEKINSGTDTWLSPVAIVRCKITNNWHISGRAEYYRDKNSVIISSNSPDGFKTTGYSLTLDHNVGENSLVRIEGRHLENYGQFLTTSIAISF